MHLKYRTVLYVWAFLLLCGRVWAQNDQHFVYIQSEKGQPFYVKLNGKVLSSTERGYIILPQIESGTTPITIGFAKDAGPEQKFSLRVSKSDQGFLLKRAGASSTLYNLQTFRETKADGGDAVAVADVAPEQDANAVPAPASEDTSRKEMMGNMQKDLEQTFANKATVTGPGQPAAKPANAFSSALDKVVVTGDDRDTPAEEAVKPAPAQEQVATVAPEVKKPRGKKRKEEKAPLTEEEQAILKDVLAEEDKTAASEVAKASATPEVQPSEGAPKEEAPKEEAPKKTKKHKKREGNPDFIEFQEDGAQPASSASAPVVAPAPAVAETPAVTEEAPARSKKKKRKIFDDTEHPNNVITDSSGYGIAAATPEVTVEKSRKKKKRGEAEMADGGGVAAGAEAEAKKADTRLVNSDCGNIMNDEAFRKVLRRFVSAKSDDAMIDIFRKQTRNYCLETAQIKTLAQLLSNDEARYRLLDMGYAKTYDTEKYGSLENLLSDSYYKGRFRAMLHK